MAPLPILLFTLTTPLPTFLPKTHAEAHVTHVASRTFTLPVISTLKTPESHLLPTWVFPGDDDTALVHKEDGAQISTPTSITGTLPVGHKNTHVATRAKQFAGTNQTAADLEEIEVVWVDNGGSSENEGKSHDGRKSWLQITGWALLCYSAVSLFLLTWLWAKGLVDGALNPIGFWGLRSNNTNTRTWPRERASSHPHRNSRNSRNSPDTRYSSSVDTLIFAPYADFYESTRPSLNHHEAAVDVEGESVNDSSGGGDGHRRANAVGPADEEEIERTEAVQSARRELERQMEAIHELELQRQARLDDEMRRLGWT
ncbi:hypothetical protein GQ43DRAFT_471583 [Delitschia confertaspora ATCC 74209]|uniref:Uncharacterized protein n=1 Tax=Delitschia confertaspora ATCC 74209 TaxID=1513339 RepID=A0A9P4JNY5_9PLEO|nr:hypothetical protein GQ43DRAFT_471583 [Delitschia confertaspora ATCC 74209]